MLHFMCELDWAKGYPYSCKILFLVVHVRMFLEEISIWINTNVGGLHPQAHTQEKKRERNDGFALSVWADTSIFFRLWALFLLVFKSSVWTVLHHWHSCLSSLRIQIIQTTGLLLPHNHMNQFWIPPCMCIYIYIYIYVQTSWYSHICSFCMLIQ
jgi:hypothetical protein